MIRGILVCILLLICLPYMIGVSMGQKEWKNALILGFPMMWGITAIPTFRGFYRHWTVNHTTVMTGLVLFLCIIVFSVLCKVKPSVYLGVLPVIGNHVGKLHDPSMNGKSEGKTGIRAWFTFSNVLLLLTILIIVYQMVRFITMEMFIDGDDYTYMSLINDSVVTNHFYLRNPTTGGTVTNIWGQFNYKYLFTTFYPQMAMLTKLAGVNGNVLSHTIFPAFVIGYSYLAMWELAGFFMKKRDARVTAFFVWTLCMEYGLWSYYTFSRRLMMYVWNSKSVCFCALMPMLMYWVFQVIADGKYNRLVKWLGMPLMMLGCAVVTLMGAGLAPAMISIQGLILSCHKKSVKPLLYVVYVMLPAVFIALEMVIYLKKGVLPWQSLL
ncbi:MAG: DUF6077 domain-containing protein [Lachnospiraceae bacterium]|nr:DUF6077 domain-containing protein [Lachnospiraceae bacterium]